MKVGDKIVCIDTNSKTNKLEKFKIYTIRWISTKYTQYIVVVKLKDVKDENEAYNVDQFVTLQGYRKLKLEKLNNAQ